MRFNLVDYISMYDKKKLDDIALEIKIREYIDEVGSDWAKSDVKFVGRNEFILKYFPPATLNNVDCIYGLFSGWAAADWNSKIFERIPERIYTDTEFLSSIKYRLEIIKHELSYDAYEDFKERFCLYAPDSVKLFVILQC